MSDELEESGRLMTAKDRFEASPQDLILFLDMKIELAEISLTNYRRMRAELVNLALGGEQKTNPARESTDDELDRVRTALQDAAVAEYGRAWSYGEAHRFALAAIEAVREWH